MGHLNIWQQTIKNYWCLMSLSNVIGQWSVPPEKDQLWNIRCFSEVEEVSQNKWYNLAQVIIMQHGENGFVMFSVLSTDLYI